MIEILNKFSENFSNFSLLSVILAYLWGILSLLLSPCHLTSIPLLVGYILGNKISDKKLVIRISVFFSIGILVAILIIGLIVTLFGFYAANLWGFGNLIIGIIILLFGLSLINVFKIPSIYSQSRGQVETESLPVKGGIIGFTFGVGLAPCTLAFMAPILFFLTGSSLKYILYGLTLVTLFGIGHISPIIASGISFEKIIKLSSLGNKKAIKYIRILCGVLIIILGIKLIFDFVKTYI